nr:eukaryotic translation initiation factor 4E [Cryptomonas curvata]
MLKYKWTFWFDKPDLKISDENWDQFLVKIDSFQTIRGFWCIFNNILLPSEFQHGINLHLFKSHIEPKWEDINNFHGGKWMITISKQIGPFVNKLWEKTLVALIGGIYDDIVMESINGIVLSVRKNIIKIAIWTKDSFDINLQLKIGKLWKSILKQNLFLNNLILEYYPHTTFLVN